MPTLNLLSLFRTKRHSREIRKPEKPLPIEQRGSVRREIVKLYLRDSLVRARVPTDWVGVEVFPAAPRGAVSQVHVRLVLLQWDNRLVHSISELERGFVRRLTLLDGTSTQWVRDVSWRLALSLHRLPGRDLAHAADGHVEAEPKSERPNFAETVSWTGLLDPEQELHAGRRRRTPADFSPTQPMV